MKNKRLTRSQRKKLQTDLALLIEHLELRSNFLKEYSEVYKLPKLRSQTNINVLERSKKAAQLIIKTIEKNIW